MILNGRLNGYVVNLPQDFFNKEIDKKYAGYYRSLLLPYKNVSEFMSSTIQGFTVPGFNSILKQQVGPLGKMREYQSGVPVADQFSRQIILTFKLSDGWINYWIFLDNMLNYLEPANVSPTNTQHSLGQALSVPPVANSNHPFFSPIRLTILNNEGYAITSVIFNRPEIKGLSDFSPNYTQVGSEPRTFSVTFQYYNFDLETEFD